MFKAEHEYQIAHTYGLRGSRRAAFAFGCKKTIDFSAPKAGERVLTRLFSNRCTTTATGTATTTYHDISRSRPRPGPRPRYITITSATTTRTTTTVTTTKAGELHGCPFRHLPPEELEAPDTAKALAAQGLRWAVNSKKCNKDTPPSTVIRKTIGARDPRISYIFLICSYYFCSFS